MISDGMYFKLVEDRDNVFNHIKELESERLENDPTDVHRLDCLYEVYRNICDLINDRDVKLTK